MNGWSIADAAIPPPASPICCAKRRFACTPTNHHMTNPFTQQQIADITGQTSVNVNRVLADMERQGLIRRKGREIEFTDWAKCAASRASSRAI